MDEVLVFHLQSGAVRSFLSLIDQPPWTYIHDTYPQYCCLIYTVKLNAALSTECLVHKSIWVRAMYQHYCQGSVHCVSIVTQLLWVQTSAVKHCQKLPVGGWPGVLSYSSVSIGVLHSGALARIKRWMTGWRGSHWQMARRAIHRKSHWRDACVVCLDEHPIKRCVEKVYQKRKIKAKEQFTKLFWQMAKDPS